MINEVENALTRGDCTTALIHSTRLYESQYSDNRIRMLYVSSQGCRAGIIMYQVYEELASLSSTNPIADFVRIFSSLPTDTKMQSSWLAMDALQSVITPGTAVSQPDQTLPQANNPGSVNYQDLTADAKIYGLFLSMAAMGTTLNRNPNLATQEISWVKDAGTSNLDLFNNVKNDTSQAACSIASAYLMFLDSAAAVQTQLPGPAAAAVGGAVTLLSTVETLGTDFCKTGIIFPLGPNPTSYSAPQCAEALRRLRYRASCSESPVISMVAAGILFGVDQLWQ
jgi:hypothetical protein